VSNHPAVASSTARPRLRGVIHHYAFFVSLVAGALLVALVPDRQAFVAACVYAASLSALLGTSALYHRITWSPAARRWMGRLDHSMISVLIAGTYTPFGMTALSGSVGAFLLVAAWGGAAAGIGLHVLWLDAPKWLSAATYVAMGWVGVAAAPAVVAGVGWTAAALLLAGGVVYSVGAYVYAVRRPDPVPAVFGYHEVFHALVVLAALTHYVAVAITLLR
jgi:hemolysin III